MRQEMPGYTYLNYLLANIAFSMGTHGSLCDVWEWGSREGVAWWLHVMRGADSSSIWRAETASLD